MGILLAENKTVFLPVFADLEGDSAGCVLYAANELARFLSEISGAEWPVVFKPVGKCIRVAASNRKALGAEGVSIKAKNGEIEIAGGYPRGVIYAAYEFLERLGCRWFSSEVSNIPRRSRLFFPETEYEYAPPLEYRDIINYDIALGSYGVRNKFNGQFINAAPAQGGKVAYYPFVHTFDSLMSPDEFFGEHPEYFSMVNGERVNDRTDWGSRTQLCLTNPDVKNICAERVEAWIAEHPEATIFSVSQNDWYNPCDCPECARLNEEEGSRSGPLIHFVNYIAEYVGKKHPDVVIDTLAYQWTRKAPKRVRPLPNVCVRLCSIECCFAHPLRSCEADMGFFNRAEKLQTFQQDLEDWAKISDRLYIWDYVVNFAHYLLPFPNFGVLKDNINYFIENHVKGIFEEAAPAYAHPGQEFAEMRSWVLGKLLWDPTLDTNDLVHEFIAGYYKSAADPIRAYFHLIHDAAAADPKAHFGIYKLPAVHFLTPEIISAAKALFKKAEALADCDGVLKRVRVAGLGVRYYDIITAPLDNPARKAAVEKFINDLEELGVHAIREGVSFNDSCKALREGMNDLWYPAD